MNWVNTGPTHILTVLLDDCREVVVGVFRHDTTSDEEVFWHVMPGIPSFGCKSHMLTNLHGVAPTIETAKAAGVSALISHLRIVGEASAAVMAQLKQFSILP